MDALAGPNEFSEFYRRLKSLKDFHRQFPNELVEPMELDFAQLAQERETSIESELETATCAARAVC